MTPIETAARAMNAVTGRDWEKLSTAGRQEYIEYAKAAFRSVQRPSMYMIIKGGDFPVSINEIWPALVETLFSANPWNHTPED